MHEKCMNMLRAKRNCIMGSTQSKPINTQFSTYKHTSKYMKHCENANGIQCMIIYQQINNTKPKNFTKNLKCFKNPKNFTKPKKPRSNA